MRRGAAMLQVLVITALLLAAAVAVMRWALMRHHMSARAAESSELKMDAEGARAGINACLGGAGYPSGSCQPTPAQAACVPAGVTVNFSGAPPDCKVEILSAK